VTVAQLIATLSKLSPEMVVTCEYDGWANDVTSLATVGREMLGDNVGSDVPPRIAIITHQHHPEEEPYWWDDHQGRWVK
jgi:hypothetical protein